MRLVADTHPLISMSVPPENTYSIAEPVGSTKPVVIDSDI